MFCWNNMSNLRSRLLRALRRHYSAQSAAFISPERTNAKPFEQIPGPKGKYTIPWIGTFLLTRSMGLHQDFKFADFVTKLQDNYGDLVKTRLKNKWAVFVYHPDVAKEVMEIRTPLPYRPPIDVLAVYNSRKKHCQSLATTNGEAWASLRKPTQELITKPAVVADYVHILSGVANDFVEKYKNGGKVEDLRSTLVTYATESVGMLCFNRRLGCIDGQAIIDINLLEDMFEGLFIDLNYQGVKLYKYFETPFYKKIEKAADHLYGICHAEIKTAMEKLETAKREGKIEEYLDGPNLLYSMLTHPSMTLEYTERSIMDLFVGGVESTANTLTFLWFELAKNPEKQQRLYEEIISVCGDSDVTKEALTKMSYLKACVREIMRLYRPTNLQFRHMESEAVIGGYRIPPGTNVFVCSKVMGEDPRFFKSPEVFLPERFVRGDSSLSDEYKNTHPFATLPFGFGLRSCVGQRFAETEMHVITAKFFRCFEAALSQETSSKMEFVYRAFTAPKNKVSLLIKQRK